MSDTIFYVDQSKIRAGKFEPLQEAMNELVQFIDINEPQLIAYNVYFNKDRSRMTVIHVHADATSLQFHMDVAGRMFPRFSQFIQLQAIDVFGNPNEHLVRQLRQKAEMLGNGTVHIHNLHDGFDRFPMV